MNPQFYLSLVIGLLLASALGYADGPGLPNTTYTNSQLYKQLSVFDENTGSPRGHNAVIMHRGYLVAPGSGIATGGGGGDTGMIAVFDISDPVDPELVFTTHNNPNYAANTQHYAGVIREAHTIAVSEDYMALAAQDNDGTSWLQIWDISNLDKPPSAEPDEWMGPRLVSNVVLTGLAGGNYRTSPWWTSWNGRYIYIAGTDTGLYVVDAKDPTNATLAKFIPESEITNPQLVFAVGDRMVLGVGFAAFMYDISDPLNPERLKFDNRLKPADYSSQFRGGNLIISKEQVEVWDLHDPVNPVLLGTSANNVGSGGDDGGYLATQDGYIHNGASTQYTKIRMSDMAIVGKSGSFNLNSGGKPDYDFATPLGHLVFVGNDHQQGDVLIPHQTQPDTNPPSVIYVRPEDGQQAVRTSTSVGLNFSDFIDVRSVDTSSIIIRPINGSAVSGRYAHEIGNINFTPDDPFLPGTTYKIIVPAGGVRDYAGNAVSQSFSSTFTTDGESTEAPLELTLNLDDPVVEGNSASLRVSASGGDGSYTYSWEMGDGRTRSGSNVNYTYSDAGHYQVTVTVESGTQRSSKSGTQTVVTPLASNRPTHASSIIYDESRDRVWVVNPDANTITAINANNHKKILEVPAGVEPRSLAQAPNGDIWVANETSSTLTIHDPVNGDVVQTVEFTPGTSPFGVVSSPTGDFMYSTVQYSQALVRHDPDTGEIIDFVTFPAVPRGVAVSPDGSTIYVSRFISPDSNGEVWKVDASNMSLVDTIIVHYDNEEDDGFGGRGVPNYLNNLTISPDGQRLLIPSKKDNISRGIERDGLDLGFENMVRTILSQIDLSTDQENQDARVDFNDREGAFAVTFNPLGDYAFVALQGSNAIEIVDAYSNEVAGAINTAGLAPQGLVHSPSGDKLFVQGFMSRTVEVFDVARINDSIDSTIPHLASVDTVANELLSNEVLLGKQIFYNAADSRMTQKGYISCASCPLDGGHDGRVWDFTERGEGFRNTQALTGGGAVGGPFHWTANFDEFQDFENDIRNEFGGEGFLTNAEFNDSSDPLGAPKAGLDGDLDALAAYMESLKEFGISPYRAPDGELTAQAIEGQQIFTSMNCADCHGGDHFTDGRLHDVGTLKSTSGQRMGGTLTGIETPTLRSLWLSAPYFHDGSAGTLGETLTVAHIGASLSETEKSQLVAYLLQIDDLEPGPEPSTPVSVTELDDSSTSNTNAIGGWWSVSDPSAEGGSFSTAGANATNEFEYIPGVSGNYYVEAKWPAISRASAGVPYSIHHAGGTVTISVDQTRNAGEWVRLSSDAFALDNDSKVVISGDVLQDSDSQQERAVADGVRFVAADATDEPPVDNPPDDEPPVDDPVTGEQVATIAIDPWSQFDGFRLSITNGSSSASITAVELTVIGGGRFDTLGTDGSFSLSPDPGASDNSGPSTLSLDFGSGLAAGSSVSIGSFNDYQAGDIDGNFNGINAQVTFSDGTTLGGDLDSVSDPDGGTSGVDEDNRRYESTFAGESTDEQPEDNNSPNIYFEAENADNLGTSLADPWAAVSGSPGYIVWDNGGAFAITDAGDNNGGVAQYSVSLAAEATVDLRTRAKFDGAADNSFFVRLAGYDEEWKLVTEASNSGFEWMSAHVWTGVPAGDYTLEVQTREANTEIDRFYITTDGTDPE